MIEHSLERCHDGAPSESNGYRPPFDPIDPRVAAAEADAQRAVLEAKAAKQARIAEAEARIEERRLLRAEEAEVRQARRADRRERRRRRWRGARPLVKRAAFVAAMCLCNGAAVFGQYTYASESIKVDGVSPVLVGLWFAAALESIALVFQGLAVRALLRGDAWMTKQLMAYAVAGVVAGINYAHWASGWSPNERAVAFAAFSMLSPLLWGGYARDQHRDELHAAGLVDARLPKFSLARRLLHPVWCLRALSFAAWHGSTSAADAVCDWEAAGRPNVKDHARTCRLCRTHTRSEEPTRAPAVPVGRGKSQEWFSRWRRGSSVGTKATGTSTEPEPTEQAGTETTGTSTEPEPTEQAGTKATGTPGGRGAIKAAMFAFFKKALEERGKPPSAPEMQRACGGSDRIARRYYNEFCALHGLTRG